MAQDLEETLSDDPHLELKQSYWDIKYREWRPVLIAAPFGTFFLGGLLTFIFLPRTLIQEVPVDRVVTKEVVKEVQVPVAVDNSDPRHLPPPVIVDGKYQDRPCSSDPLVLTIYSNESVLLPRSCRTDITATRGQVRVEQNDGKDPIFLTGGYHTTTADHYTALRSLTAEARVKVVIMP